MDLPLATHLAFRILSEVRSLQRKANTSIVCSSVEFLEGVSTKSIRQLGRRLSNEYMPPNIGEEPRWEKSDMSCPICNNAIESTTFVLLVWIGFGTLLIGFELVELDRKLEPYAEWKSGLVSIRMDSKL
ncbi:hypothetical protein Tco_0599088 [Tanacetum coccineum]